MDSKDEGKRKIVCPEVTTVMKFTFRLDSLVVELFQDEVKTVS